MLIDFTVENYRSIKDPITISTVALGGKRPSAKSSKRRNIKPDHAIASTFRIEGRDIELLPVIGIFGANASGKSNVLQSLIRFLLFTQLGSSQGETNYLSLFPPFALSDTTKDAPTRFGLRIVRDANIFTYTVELSRTRILQEKLEYIPPPPHQMRNRLLYNRVWEKDLEAYVFSNGKDFGNAYREIQESLRAHEPFMSLLVTRLDVGVVRPFVSWIKTHLGGGILGTEQVDYNWAAKFLKNQLSFMLESVTRIIRHFDTGIAGIEIETQNTESENGGDTFRVWVIHEAGNNQIRWRMEEESTGTQRLFSLALKILVMFHTGGLLLEDEFGSNIHPNIIRAIVRMFQSEQLNPKRAQLIFTSHDNTLQRGNLLRRDQLWFTQKRADGSTELYSLSDFRPRNDLAIDKAYLDGRFGAVPILPDEEELLKLAELAR